MAKLALFLLGAIPAATSAADVTPQGIPIVGSGVAISAAYTVELFTVRTIRDETLHASIQTRKKDPVHGILVMEQMTPVGGSLGVTEGANLDKLHGISPKLRVLLKGDPPVSFDPNVKLISVKQLPNWTIRVCLLTNVPEGLGCVESENRRISMTVNEVVLQDASGKKFTLRNSIPPGRMPSDRRCTFHGGHIRARELAETEKEEARAGFLLADADEDWNSRNPKVQLRAREAYVKLVKDFGSTSIVAKNFERIKGRAESMLED